MAQSKFGSYLLESENSRHIGKQESNPVALDLEKIALMARGGVSGQGEELASGVQRQPDGGGQHPSAKTQHYRALTAHPGPCSTSCILQETFKIPTSQTPPSFPS